MEQDKKNEVFAVAWFFVSVLTLLALVSYTPDDIAFEISVPNSPVHNYVGPAGAYTAWVLILLFGKTAYFLVPLFLFWALAKWVGKKSQYLWLKIFSSVIFFTSACALFSLIGAETETSRFHSGGITGYFVSLFLSNLFGKASIFVALSLFILSLILATELLVLQMATGLFQKSKEAIVPAVLKRETFKKPVAAPLSTAKPAEALSKKFAELKGSLKEKMVKDVKDLEEPVRQAVVVPAEAPQKPQIKLSIAKEEKPKPETPKVSQEPKEVLEVAEPGSYILPPIDLLHSPPAIDANHMKNSLEDSSKILEDTLRDFGIDAKVVEVEQGPTITRYELQPAAGVKVQKITSLENDISLAMRATSVRILAPIPGKSRVGIEVPNASMATVYLKEVLTSAEFQKETSKVAIVIGKDTAGAPLVCNLADMPHLLIAGATNTGKSVCINSIITSLLYRATPEEVRFMMIDPKMVELHFYNDLPHQICPVITDKAKAPGALAWLLSEMERRYKVLSKVGAKNIISFNSKVENKEIRPETLRHSADVANDEPVIVRKMPYIVLVIDELADLMMSSAQEVETAITRLAQLARAVGIHMILATQRPSVDVITGVIKANFPARIAFQVASKVDSRTILDENGADKLLGRGDLLLMDPRKSKLIRAQGAWVQDGEIEKVTQFVKAQRKPNFDNSVAQSTDKKAVGGGNFDRDEIYQEAKRIVLELKQASVSVIQRRLGVGYTRAARLIDMMEEDGVVGPYRGAKPREILVETSSQGSGNAAAEGDEGENS